jgi:hypothetical protein
MSDRACARCGAPLDDQDRCPFDVPLDVAPLIGDAQAIAFGRASHADHELAIARWRVHHEDGAPDQVVEWARHRLAQAGHQVPRRPGEHPGA